jgi:hypothetical protein
LKAKKLMGGSDLPKSFGKGVRFGGLREFVMEKLKFSDNDRCHVRPPELPCGAGNHSGEGHGKRRGKKAEPPARETPEEMIRELRGIFCKGRYRSWTFTAGRGDTGR